MAGRRQGQIIQKGERRWLIRWPAGRTEDGRHRTKSKTIHGGRRQAERELRAILSLRDAGRFVGCPAALTLNEHLTTWLGSIETKRAPRTISTYRMLKRLYIADDIGCERLGELRTLRVQAWVNELEQRVGPRTVRMSFTVVRAACNAAVTSGLIAVNPCIHVELPKPEREEPSVLTQVQVEQLLRAFEGSRHRAFVTFMLGCGTRPSEALALTWGDIDFEKREARINKSLTKRDAKIVVGATKTGSSERDVGLPARVVAALREHRLASAYSTEEDLVFPNQAGRFLDLAAFTRRHWKPTLKEAGLPPHLRVYDMRHIHISLRIAAHENVVDVSKSVGHSSTQMRLDTYSHALEGLAQRAAQASEAAIFGAGS